MLVDGTIKNIYIKIYNLSKKKEIKILRIKDFKRHKKETDIYIQLDLYGQGKSNILQL